MSLVCLIDTSVFLNLLNVPGRTEASAGIAESFSDYVELGCTFILPMAAVLETGNHIAQNGNGHARRETALRFVEAVKGSFEDAPPWRLSEFPNCAEISTWLDRFPACAGSNKSPTRTTEGTSFGDLSILEEFNKCVKRFPMSEVFVWSLDTDLAQYHHIPQRRL